MSETSRRLDPALLGFPALKLLLQLLALPAYGWFRDEFYYLACADHLDFGYVDQPPLSIFVLWIVRSVAGDSIWAVRLLPALAGAAMVYVVGRLTREMGGGRWAQALAMLAATCAPIYLALGHFYSMNAFEALIWATAALLLVRVLNGHDRRTWIWLGLLLGLGLLNKISVLWLGFGLAVGLLATPARRTLKTPGPWMAGAVALLLFTPHLIWQVVNDWPTLEFMRNATQQKMVALEIVPFLAQQILMMGPPLAWLWITGLIWTFRPNGSEYRLLGWIWITVLVVLVASGSARAGYLSPAYTWLFAGGAVATERWLVRTERQRWRPAFFAVVASTLLLAPLGLPLLPVDTYVRYAERLGIQPATEEQKELAELPQHYADMFGWEDIVGAVADAFDDLPPTEQERTAIFANNYGVAGAIDRLGRDHGLPKAISGHNSYWLWGPGDRPIETVLIVGGDEEDHREVFESVERGPVIDCGRCMPYENGQTVFICRRPHRSLDEIWPAVKHYD